MSDTPAPIAGASQSSLWSAQLLEIGPTSASTWPRWRTRLPGAVAAFSRVVSAQFYVTGHIRRPNYSEANLEDILKDPVKAKDLNNWANFAEALKAIVTAWGGSQAATAIELFDTTFGNIRPISYLQQKLLNSLGDSGTGAKKVVVVKLLTRRDWLEDEDPHLYFAAFEGKLAQLNASYKADADAFPDNQSVDAQANRLAAFLRNLAHNLVLCNVPSSYANIITPHLKRGRPTTTSWSRSSSSTRPASRARPSSISTLAESLHATSSSPPRKRRRRRSLTLRRSTTASARAPALLGAPAPRGAAR
ncbi:hypothetical protein JCM9279_003775 [Rhodotorula babjevae]